VARERGRPVRGTGCCFIGEPDRQLNAGLSPAEKPPAQRQDPQYTRTPSHVDTHEGRLVVRTPMPRLGDDHQIDRPLLHAAPAKVLERAIDHSDRLALGDAGAELRQSALPCAAHAGGRLDAHERVDGEGGVLGRWGREEQAGEYARPGSWLEDREPAAGVELGGTLGLGDGRGDQLQGRGGVGRAGGVVLA